jgi:hypothetical protein
LAQELLGAPTIGRASAQSGDGGGGSQRSQISLPSRPKYKRWRQNGKFPALFALKTAENAVFYLKVLNKIYSRDIF